jgi:hypothetical protein
MSIINITFILRLKFELEVAKKIEITIAIGGHFKIPPSFATPPSCSWLPASLVSSPPSAQPLLVTVMKYAEVQVYGRLIHNCVVRASSSSSGSGRSFFSAKCEGAVTSSG